MDYDLSPKQHCCVNALVHIYDSVVSLMVVCFGKQMFQNVFVFKNWTICRHFVLNGS